MQAVPQQTLLPPPSVSRTQAPDVQSDAMPQELPAGLVDRQLLAPGLLQYRDPVAQSALLLQVVLHAVAPQLSVPQEIGDWAAQLPERHRLTVC
jgi:hypothetical protein